MDTGSILIYGKYGHRINLDRFMIYSCCLCILSYLGISLLPIPQLSLAACAVCGLAVGIMWPGSFSKAAAAIPKGGTAMFAFLALGGDLGCSGGPTVVGAVSTVGIMWPGSFSKAAAAIPKGGTAMFAFLALGGDLGCSGGPTVVGAVSSAFGDNLKMGILAGVIFPVLLLGGILVCRKIKAE